MPKKRILIFGEVHDVGYRPFLLKVAGLFDIKRFYADNLIIGDKKAVEVLIDDEEDKELFKKYIERLEKKDKLIEIEKIEERKLNAYIDFSEGISRLSAKLLKKVSSKQDGMLHFVQHPLLDFNRFLLFPISNFCR